ncbi:putative membrane protein [Agrobacterium tumefaciens]|uniref:TadG family pilus assembly protein n=1 Tax=Agrobacterium tumefaciens TaxID=358 RepID=UPI000DD09A0D|nr:TadG family pilus assembly protein [Agrobacterium tumefaciens]MBP2506606.1 putative membrane protein [Agrobacterium tumefaciens]MBP2516992.1 putative membrane protein [Agrobacterium tumefaciens]MBP2575626.1 putative membrane protein [Agrobacterium tumefaciens]MBP2592748.1 putative membrane protein [Agrobacterium tumefaciens]
MRDIHSLLPRFLRDRTGNIAISAGLTAPLFIGILALGVDYGYLTLQKRQLQQTADLAAISAAANAADAEKAVQQYFALNGMDLGVRTAQGILTAKGLQPFDPLNEFASSKGYAEVIKGHYEPDATVPVGQRFVDNALPTNAIKVNIVEQGQIFFASAFTKPPKVSAVGTASSQKIAAFSVGSRLASLDEGILNSLLGGLLGTTVSLKLMDYQALLAADVNALKIVEALAIDLNLTAGTYKDVLKTEISYGKFLDVLTKTTGLQPTVVNILNTLQKTVNKSNVKIKLEEILNLGPFSDKLIGTGENLKVTAGVFDLINAAAVAGNGGNQLGLNLNANLLGLASVKATLAIGEPPVETPSLAVGGQGTVVRTAQTRLAVNVVVDGLQAIAGLKVNLPLYVEVAHAEARLADIRCTGGGQGTVDVEVVPGVAEIALGNVDTTAFANFGKDPRVTKAAIVDSALLSINGSALINATNMTKTKLTFTQSDITQAKIKSVSTKDTVTTLVSSLLKNLNLDIRLLFLNLDLGGLAGIQAALANTLAVVTAPVDQLLYNVLLVLGVKIGEADVRVTDVRCQQPALVQ